jgi:hypothetical protein
MKRVTNPIELTEFIDLISAYGAAPHRWPTDKRLAMEHLLTHSDEAQKSLSVEAQLDDVLDKARGDFQMTDAEALAPASPASDKLRDSLLATFDDVVNQPQTYETLNLPNETVFTRRTGLATITSLAACLAFGIMMGPFLLEAVSPIGSTYPIFESTSLDLIISQP